MKIKRVLIVASILLAFLLVSFTQTVYAADVTTNGTEVHIKPDAANGEEIVSGVKGSNVLGDIMDVLTYLIYIAALIDVLFCTLTILIGVLGGKKLNSLKAMKSELEARDGVWTVTKAIGIMWISINVLDVLYYYF